MYQKDKQTIQQEKEEQQKIDNINAEITAKNNEKTKIIKDSSINQKSIQDRIDIIQQEYEVIKNKVNHLEQ
ncbi:MAG: hypothetical protein U9532_00020 ['Conium maculatum' witches'-broom phytoplasma]|nr:hypothetical protein ['Conium maculatum' witches'-broom phytoplasma]